MVCTLRIGFCLLVVVCLLILVQSAENRGEKKKKKVRTNPQKLALENWALSLTPKDYNYTEWRIMYHSRSTVDFFNGYAKKLSNLFKEHNAKVNFVMIGNELFNLYAYNTRANELFCRSM
jgi:hypothetical protein